MVDNHGIGWPSRWGEGYTGGHAFIQGAESSGDTGHQGCGRGRVYQGHRRFVGQVLVEYQGQSHSICRRFLL